MSVKIPPVRTFPNVEPSKAQAVKVLEEAAEVFAAWQEVEWCSSCSLFGKSCDCATMCDGYGEQRRCERDHMVDECCDAIVAMCNLLASVGITDLTEAMAECEKRNEERGRYGDER